MLNHMHCHARCSSLEVHVPLTDGNVHVDHTIQRMPFNGWQTRSRGCAIKSRFDCRLLAGAGGIGHSDRSCTHEIGKNDCCCCTATQGIFCCTDVLRAKAALRHGAHCGVCGFVVFVYALFVCLRLYTLCTRDFKDSGDPFVSQKELVTCTLLLLPPRRSETQNKNTPPWVSSPQLSLPRVRAA